jgi:hypothetical protein
MFFLFAFTPFHPNIPAPSVVQIFSISGKLLTSFVNAPGMITLLKHSSVSFMKVLRNSIEPVIQIPSM